MNLYYFWIFLFVVSAYFILTDQSVSRGVFFISQIVKSKYELIKWIILNDPRNPIVKYLIWRRSFRLAEQLRKELINSNDKTSN
jgi:hypothetical protein